MRLPLTQFHAGFVCNFLSSSAGINLCRCFSRLTLAFQFPFRLSLGFHFHGLSPLPLLFLTSAVFAPFRSLQFWILTTQPLFLLFPLLPVSASQWLPQCSALPFVPAVFPVLSCLVSRAFLPGSWYSASLYVSFRPSLTHSHSCSSGAYLPLSLPVFSVPPPLSFRSLPLPFQLLSLCFFLSTFLPASASQLASSVLPFRSRFPDLSPSLRPGFPCLPSGSVYSASCSFPFVLPCFAPTAVPLVLPFQVSPPGSTLGFRFLSSTSALASHYSASASSFPLFPFPPHSWVLSVRSSSLRPRRFPLLFRLFPCFPSGSGTKLSCYSFLRSTVSRHRRYFQLPASCFQLGRSP